MIFVDTGAWVALAVATDRNAEAARAFHRGVQRGEHGAVLTTDYVLDETATLVRMDAGVEAATDTVRPVLESRSATVVWIDPTHFEAALDLFDHHRDKRWSFTDCTSFVVMRDLGIERAFAFDRNFEQAGFDRRPG